jgi:hypothetical protein
MKNIIRKVAAVGAGVVMLGSTLGGALAADLSDLSETFVPGGSYANTAFVVGSLAGTNDDSARGVLAGYFGGFVETTSGFTYDSDSDADDDILINGADNLVGFGEVDGGLLDSLFEGELEVNDIDYTTREIINFSAGTNLSTSFNGGQKEMGSSPYLAYAANAINYGFSFTDVIPNTSVSVDDPIKLSFLGKEVEVTTISNTTANTVTLDITETVSLDSDATYTYKGHVVKVVRVYSASVSIDVDGEEKIISTGNTKDFGSDIQVEIDTVGYSSDNPALSSVVLKLSEQGVASSITDNAAFELFEDYSTNSHSPWVWEVRSSDLQNLSYLGISNRWTTDDLEPSQDYKTVPITVGESVVFPNNYAAVVWDSVTTETYADFNIVLEDSRDLDDADDSNQAVDNKAMVIFTSADGDYFELGGTDYDTVYLVNNATNYTNTSHPAPLQFWGEDSDGYHHTTSSSFIIKYNDDDNDITVTNVSTTGNMSDIRVLANDWNFTFPWNYSTDFYGTEEGVDQATDFVVFGSNLGTREYDILLKDGTILLNPDSGFGADKLDFKVPSEDVEATFKVYTIASAGEVEAVLKTETGAASYDKVVLVGGPCVNTLTASFMGLPEGSCEEASTIAQDKAVIELVEKDGKTALVVAGWEKADTLRAANSVAAGGLTGTSMIV